VSRHRRDLSCEDTSDCVVSRRRGSKNRDPFRSTPVESRQLFYLVGQFASRLRLRNTATPMSHPSERPADCLTADSCKGAANYT